jgi:DNA-binding response OmpR family regulator
LQEAGFKVAVARDGADGLDLARQLKPSAIVLDVMLPTLDGWEVIARVRSDDALKDTPIIVASVVDDRARGLALGASDYLVKPVSRDGLLAAIRQVVKLG